MHNAPAVSYPVGRSALAGGAMLAAWLAGAGGIAVWAVQVAAASAVLVGAIAALLVTGGIALRAWLHSPAGTLAWDGDSWTWTAREAQSGTPEVALDAQRLILLRWQGAGGGVLWLWLDRAASSRARWDDLRRAAYSRASPKASTGAQPQGEAKP